MDKVADSTDASSNSWLQLSTFSFAIDKMDIASCVPSTLRHSLHAICLTLMRRQEEDNETEKLHYHVIDPREHVIPWNWKIAIHSSFSDSIEGLAMPSKTTRICSAWTTVVQKREHKVSSWLWMHRLRCTSSCFPSGFGKGSAVVHLDLEFFLGVCAPLSTRSLDTISPKEC